MNTTGLFATAVDAEGYNFQRYNFRSDHWEVYSEGNTFRPESMVDLSRTYAVSAKPSTAPVMAQAALDTDAAVAARRAAKAAEPKHHWWDAIIPHFGKH